MPLVQRLSKRRLTECTGTAAHRMNVCVVPVALSDSSLVQLELHRRGVLEVAGTPATVNEIFCTFLASSR